MPDPFAEVKSGDDLAIQAASYNNWQRTAKDFESKRQSRKGGPLANPRDANLILVRNDSGDDLDRSTVLAFRDPVIAPSDALDAFRDRPALAGEIPTADDVGKFGVLLAPAADGDIVIAIVSGIVAVQVDDGDGSTDFCDVADGVTDNLEMNSSGSARVMFRDAGTGPQWAIVLLGGSAGESKGEFMGMSHTMVSQNEDGWDFDELHSEV